MNESNLIEQHADKLDERSLIELRYLLGSLYRFGEVCDEIIPEDIRFKIVQHSNTSYRIRPYFKVSTENHRKHNNKVKQYKHLLKSQDNQLQLVAESYRGGKSELYLTPFIINTFKSLGE